MTPRSFAIWFELLNAHVLQFDQIERVAPFAAGVDGGALAGAVRLRSWRSRPVLRLLRS